MKLSITVKEKEAVFSKNAEKLLKL